VTDSVAGVSAGGIGCTVDPRMQEVGLLELHPLASELRAGS